jgi:hypothetical protein
LLAKDAAVAETQVRPRTKGPCKGHKRKARPQKAMLGGALPLREPVWRTHGNVRPPSFAVSKRIRWASLLGAPCLRLLGGLLRSGPSLLWETPRPAFGGRRASWTAPEGGPQGRSFAPAPRSTGVSNAGLRDGPEWSTRRTRAGPLEGPFYGARGPSGRPLARALARRAFLGGPKKGPRQTSPWTVLEAVLQKEPSYEARGPGGPSLGTGQRSDSGFRGGPCGLCTGRRRLLDASRWSRSLQRCEHVR